MYLFSSKKQKHRAGFSLVELLVSITIVTAILGFIIFNQAKYTSDSILANTADSIGLSISEAQVYSVSVKGVSTNDFSSGYGIVFNVSSSSGGRDAYLSFADKNNNGVYENSWACGIGPISECLGKIYLPVGYLINDLCEMSLGGAETCGIGRVDISFVRPYTDAHIYFFDANGAPLSYSDVKGARIKVSSPTGRTMSVVVYNTGQVSIQ